jgi:replicative DNA helicase
LPELPDPSDLTTTTTASVASPSSSAASPAASSPAKRPLPALYSLSALVDDLATDAEERHRAREAGKPFGPVTGFKGLDAALGSALGVGLHVLHGSPGVGKTAFALQVAALCGCPALYVTCEMAPLELLRRHTARVTGTFLGKFKTGELTGEAVRDLARKAAEAAPLLALLDATETPAEFDSILRPASAMQRDSPSGHVLVVIDSLHSWADSLGEGTEEYERLNLALTALRLLSKRLGCAVVVIAERNRAAMKSGGQSAGAGTRKIEYGAESVIELDADADAKPNANGEVPVQLKISKNRNGATGKPIALRFHGALQRYQEAGTAA